MSDKPDKNKPAARHSTLTVLIGVIALILTGGVLYLCQSVIIPLIFAYLLSYLVSPILTALKKAKVPAPLGVLIIVIMLLTGGSLLGWFLYERVGEFAKEFPGYQSKFMVMAKDIMARFNVEPTVIDGINWMKLIGSPLLGFFGSFVGFMSNTMLVLIFLVFMLLEQGHLNAKLIRALDKGKADKVSNAVDSITSQIRRYLQIKVLVSFITAVLVWLVLTVLGIDFAATWGMLAFLLNFIPNVGSIIASVPPIIVAFVDNYDSSAVPIVLTAVFILMIQVIMGNIVEPKMQGQGLNLSPVIILISLVFWGWLWGIPGMLLSVPIASFIKITCENIDSLKPVSVFMSGGFRTGEEPGQSGKADTA